jgi:hypothetical protein
MIRKQKGRVKSGSTVVRLAAKMHTSLSKITIMLIGFSLIRVVHHEFVPQGQTVNATFSVEVLKRLHERVRRVQPELWAEKK